MNPPKKTPTELAKIARGRKWYEQGLKKLKGGGLDKAIFKYYLALGPTRSIKDVWAKWRAYIGIASLQRLAMQQDWWTKAWEYDSRQLDRVVRNQEDRNNRLRQLILQGIDSALAKVFVIGLDGKVTSKLEVKSFDDLAKLIRINDYLSENQGRDPKDLSDVTHFQANYHMAIVQAIKGAEVDYTNSERLTNGWSDDTRRIPRINAGQVVEGDASLQDQGRAEKDPKPRTKRNPKADHPETPR